jgi:hypothetical protein
MFIGTDNYHLKADSPCIDTGTNSPVLGLEPQDFDGTARPLDGNMDGNSVADMGMYEYDPAVPCMELSDAFIEFQVPLGTDDPNSQSFFIRNCCGDALDWTIVYDCPWLTITPESDQSTGQWNEVLISPSVTGLDYGTYNCELFVTAPNALNSPQILPVSLHVYIEGERHVPAEYETVWEAVDAAVDGDEVIINPGRHFVANGIWPGGKAITIRSIDPTNPAIVASTIIYPYGFLAVNGEGPNTVVDGLTFINHGIYCDGSSPTIRNCIIRDCFSEPEGGGILLEDSNSLIERCIIENNISYESCGGISCMGGNPVIKNCLITNNSICGISTWGSNLTVENCTIADNLVALWWYEGTSGIILGPGSDSAVRNSTIWNNSSGDGNEVVLESYAPGAIPITSVAAISYCDIEGEWEGISVDPNCTLNWGAGNFGLDPCFAEPGLVGPSTGLISYWMFDEGEGTIAYDSVGYNTGTVEGAQWTTGKIEGALEFGGVDDYVTVGKNDRVFPNNILTWSVWVNPSSYVPDGVILWDDDYQATGDRGIQLRSDGRIGAGEWFYDTISSSVISLGEWHHIAFTSGNGERKLYIEGELSDTSPGLLPDHTDRSFVSIGSGHNGYHGYFHGMIDEVAIYDRALSSEEVQDIHLNGLNKHGLLVNLPGDYHLKSQAGRWKPSIYIGLDPTGDGFIDLSDFAAFANSWQTKGGFIPADLDRNGIVDLSDLKLFLDNYLVNYPLGEWVTDDVTSPCIDSGGPSDWTEELWPHGRSINMGAYGGTGQASMSLWSIGNIADVTCDGGVNFADFASLAYWWHVEQVLLAEDFDRNGVVNRHDLKILCDNWLEGF